MKKLLCVLLCALPNVLFAKVDSISIPHQGWKIVVDAPPLTPVDRNSGPQGFSYMANSGNFNLSLLVEPSAVPGGGNKECYEFYWAKASRNPMINLKTVQVSHTPAYYRVEYMDDLDPGFRQRNVNYYFAYNERWVDVHISMVESAGRDDGLFAAFDRSLKVEKEVARAPIVVPANARLLRLSDTDALMATPPKNWEMGEVTQPTKQFPLFTFPFDPMDGRNASCLVSVYARYKPGTIKPEMLRQMLTMESKPWIANTADQKMPGIHEITLTHGYGVYASFIDAKLVGKPSKPDDFKIAVSFALSVQGRESEYLTKVSVLCDDLSSSEYRDAVTLVKSLAEVK